MKTPRLPPRRFGWEALLALAALLLGAAFAVRLGKRKRRAQPDSSPRLAVAAPAAGRSDAERSLLRMAIGGGIVVALAIAITVVTRPSEGAVPGPGPASRFESVLLTGTRGTRAVLSVAGIRDGQTGLISGYPQWRYVVLTIHVRNTGADWIDTSFVNSWLADSTDLRFPVEQSSYGLSVSMLDAGREIDRVVEVFMPHAGLRRLHLEMAMGDDTEAAEWNLP